MAILKMIFLFQRCDVLGIISLECVSNCGGSCTTCGDVEICNMPNELENTSPVTWVHPPKQTWNLKMDPWERRFLLETIISRFHVNFWGCMIFPGFQCNKDPHHTIFLASHAQKATKLYCFLGTCRFSKLVLGTIGQGQIRKHFLPPGAVVDQQQSWPLHLWMMLHLQWNPPKDFAQSAKRSPRSPDCVCIMVTSFISSSRKCSLFAGIWNHIKSPVCPTTTAEPEKTKPRLMVDQWQKNLRSNHIKTSPNKLRV